MKLPPTSIPVRRVSSPFIGSRRREEADPSTGFVWKSASAPRRLQRASAFTLVEIALCLAIIGFALVAIIGVLPAGLNVQKENREETIITQEGNYFVDAIRNGARGLDELTNNIISITNYWTQFDTNNPSWTPGGSGADGYTFTRSHVTSINSVAEDAYPLTNGIHILGLLGRPKYEADGTFIRSNHVVVLARALSGAATEKFPQANVLVQDLAFSYRMVAEVHQVPQAFTNSVQAQLLNANLHEVRLKFSWPLLSRGNVGNGRQTVRALAGGQLQTGNIDNQPVFFFNPALY